MSKDILPTKDQIADVIKHCDETLENKAGSDEDLSLMQGAKDLADLVRVIIIRDGYAGRRYTLTLSTKEDVENINFQYRQHKDTEVDLGDVVVADLDGNRSKVGVKVKMENK